MSTRIETERLILRPFELDDAEAVFAFSSHPEVSRYTGDAGLVSTIDDARKIITDTWHADYATYGYGRLAVVDKATGCVFGFCGLKYLTDLEETDIGYRFLPEFWGRGIATEAATAAMAHGREELGLTNIIGLVLPENAASIRVLEKLGLWLSESIELDGDEALVFREPGDERRFDGAKIA